MDHESAVRANAVERYVLGDLPLAEVEDFERHFYECSQCSEELRALSILTANLRVVLSEEAISPPSRALTAEPVVEKPVQQAAVFDGLVFDGAEQGRRANSFPALAAGFLAWRAREPAKAADCRAAIECEFVKSWPSAGAGAWASSSSPYFTRIGST